MTKHKVASLFSRQEGLEPPTSVLETSILPLNYCLYLNSDKDSTYRFESDLTYFFKKTSSFILVLRKRTNLAAVIQIEIK